MGVAQIPTQRLLQKLGSGSVDGMFRLLMPNQISPWESDEIAPGVSVTITLRKLQSTDTHTHKSEVEKSSTNREDQDRLDKSHYKEREQPLDSDKALEENPDIIINEDQDQRNLDRKTPANDDADQNVIKDNSDKKVINFKL